MSLFYLTIIIVLLCAFASNTYLSVHRLFSLSWSLLIYLLIRMFEDLDLNRKFLITAKETRHEYWSFISSKRFIFSALTICSSIKKVEPHLVSLSNHCLHFAFAKLFVNSTVLRVEVIHKLIRLIWDCIFLCFLWNFSLTWVMRFRTIVAFKIFFINKVLTLINQINFDFNFFIIFNFVHSSPSICLNCISWATFCYYHYTCPPNKLYLLIVALISHYLSISMPYSHSSIFNYL